MDSLVQLALSPSTLLIGRSCGGAELGTPTERSALLKTEQIQTFLSTACNTLQNGGPRTDQEYKFNCRLLTLYPLHFAAMVGDVDTIKSLIHTQNRDPNMKCPEMNDIQAIGLAASYGHLLAVIALLKEGADPFELNKVGYDAFFEARRERHQHIATFLEDLVQRMKSSS